MRMLRAIALAAAVITLPPVAATTAAAQMPGYGPGYMGGPGMMGGYGPGYMMGPGMMGGYGPGMMPGYGPGMMQGYGPGYMMGPGMMGGYGPGMMPGYGPGYGQGYGPGMMRGYGPGNRGDLNLSTEQVKSYLERMIAVQGNSRLKVGEVKEKDADTIVADVVTKDNSLVQRFVVNRRNGFYQPEQ